MRDEAEPATQQLDLQASLRRHRVMAIIRGDDPEASVRSGIALAEEGFRLIEVSLTGIDAFAVISRIAHEAPQALVGAGTVLSGDQVRQAEQAGARYIVTPGMTPSVPDAVWHGIPVLAGALTPSEVLAALASGASAVKIFPASVFGPDYIKALRGPIPDAPLIPVGGIDIDQAAAYLRAGATAVGLGSPLLGDAAEGGDLEGLRRRARRLLVAMEFDEVSC